MLHTCGRTVLEKLAKAKGKSVTSIDLFEIPSFSLIQFTTESGNIYVIETQNIQELHGAKRMVIAHPKMNRVFNCALTHGVLCIGKSLSYVVDGKTHSTLPLKEIHLLST